jgi:SAM-dependent methyltransferase
MLDEAARRRKAAKIIAVVRHFAGDPDLAGWRALDIGCSAGYIADELRQQQATVTGIDIDASGLAQAAARFGPAVSFLSASGDSVPVADASVDLIVFNHIYEHAVDADAVMTEIRRVLKPDGLVYLGLGNRFGVVEPHYQLPFLSWLPPRVADRYVRLAGRAPHYHERFRTRGALVRMCRGLNVWEYTYSVLSDPQDFASEDMVKGRLATLPPPVWRALTPIIPTFIWVGTPGNRTPAGPSLRVPPHQIARR